MSHVISLPLFDCLFVPSIRTINQTIEGLKQAHSTQLAEALEAKLRAEAAAQQEEIHKTAALEEAKLAQEVQQPRPALITPVLPGLSLT